MSLSVPLLLLTSFLASAVEAVEALTIVLAVGVTRGWRSALLGIGAGFIALAAVVGILGPSILQIPIGLLQVLIGVLLLLFGLQWLRKAVLRSAGLKSFHDEEKIYAREVTELSAEPRSRGAFDPVGFTVSMKGVFLEGLEVVFIVLTFGLANKSPEHPNGDFGTTILGALLAVLVVTVVGVIVHRPLKQVPENSIKFAVGAILTAFGTFWAGEGIGIEWTLHEVTILLLSAVYLLLGLAWAAALRRSAMPAKVEQEV